MASQTDLDLVGRVTSRLGERADAEGIESLTPAECVVLLPWWATGIICNGGFQYFFEGATNTLEVADAFAALGLEEAAAACRAAHRLIPVEVLQEGYPAFRDWMDTLDESRLEGLFDPLNPVIWDHEVRLVAALAADIRNHGMAAGGG
jgi:hypothetical protein